MKAYYQAFCRAAQAAGITRLNFYMEERLSRSLAVYEGALERLERAEQRQLFVEGEVDGLCGSVFVEQSDPALIPDQIRCILDSAQALQTPFVPYELDGLDRRPDVDYHFTDLERTVTAMCQGEQAAYDADERIVPGVQVSVTELGFRYTLMDERGNYATDVTMGGSCGVRLAARQGEQVQPGGVMKPFHADNNPRLAEMARAAAAEAVSRLDAGSYATGTFPVVLESKVVGELLDAFMPAFFAKNVHSGMSVLAGREGGQVAGENITICEDPTLAGGFRVRRFDDEGVATTAKEIVSAGRLNCLLHNRQTARAAGCAGGNGFKANFNEPVSTGYTNVYIRPGGHSLDELLEQMGQGLLITEVSGVFAGARPNSGVFSLIAQGYRVEGGKRGRAVTQITIAGNFFDLLGKVVAVGSDEHWKRAAAGCVRTPSLYVSEVAISGKE